MIHQKHFLRSLLLLSLMQCSLIVIATAQSSGKVLVKVKHVEAPVFTGMTHNAVMRVGVYVPANKTFSVRQVRFSSDQATIRIVEKIQMVMRADKEPAFPDNASPVASVNPQQGITTVQVDIPCTPGWNYFWVSITLKQD